MSFYFKFVGDSAEESVLGSSIETDLTFKNFLNIAII